MNELAGRIAIVGGAARGVGAAIVRELIARGARVLAVDNGASIDGRSEDPALGQKGFRKPDQDVGADPKGGTCHATNGF